MSRRGTGRAWALAGLALALALPSPLAWSQTADALQRELDFCSGLVRYRFPD